MNSEKGVVLPLVLAVMAVGTLLLAPFLSQASTTLMSANDYGQSISAQYAADAGVEHAVWDLLYDDLATRFSAPGDSFNYQLGESVNGIAPDITVTLSGSSSYSIVSIADSRRIEAVVATGSGSATILDWRVE